jgi:hypothetical protein
VEGDATMRVLEATLSHEALDAYRQRFPAHLDADGFTLSD